jgi:plastocyanin
MRLGKWAARMVGELVLGALAVAWVPAAQVTGHVTVIHPKGPARTEDDRSVVAWITPVIDHAEVPQRAENNLAHPRLIQKNKLFEPHVLVVQVGSAVDFPNRDPFFHNVFSLFDGKRFDLGLYEAGSTRTVHFDRAGICYIFCNIHPQMSAVVVVVDTPHFAVSNEKGEIVIPNVPAGEYQLNFWAEHSAPAMLKTLSKPISVSAESTAFGEIRVEESSEPITTHLNKYGKQYDPQVFSSPIYVQP